MVPLKTAVLAALVAVLVLAPASEAHTLKMPRAYKANKTFSKLVCEAVEGDATCLASRPGRCKRISPHRARCNFFLTMAFEDGSVARCRSLIDWYIRARNARLHPNYLGIRSCTELQPPTTEEPTP